MELLMDGLGALKAQSRNLATAQLSETQISA